MKRVCSYCKKIYGYKEPLDDESETHGACDTCLKIEMEKIKNQESRIKKKERRKEKGERMKMKKIIFGKCDFRSNRDEPIGTLVDEYDTNHKNPQFTVMVD